MSLDLPRPAGRWRPRDDQERAGTNRFIAPGTETDGEFGLFEGVLAPGQGAIPHFHEGFSESFFILSGELRIRVADETRAVTEGDFVYVPRNGIHVFRNDGQTDVRLLMLFAPGAPREGYFRALAEAFGGDREPTADEIDAIAREFDQTNLRDPQWALP